MPTLAEIDEALGHANSVPLDERGTMWMSFVDRLLEERNQVSAHATA